MRLGIAEGRRRHHGLVDVDAGNAGALRRRRPDLQGAVALPASPTATAKTRHGARASRRRRFANGSRPTAFRSMPRRRNCCHEQWTKRRAALAAQLQQQFPGTNLNSRPQIGALLEARGWVPEQRTEKTKQPKINDEVTRDYPGALSRVRRLGRVLSFSGAGSRSWRPARRPGVKHVGADGRIHGGLDSHRHAAQPRQAS